MTPRHHSIEGASLLRRTLAAPLLWLTLGTALAAYFLCSAPAPATLQPAAKTTQATSTELKPRYVTKPIRDIAPIVDRVLADNPEEDPDVLALWRSRAKTTQALSLTGLVVKIQLLTAIVKSGGGGNRTRVL